MTERRLEDQLEFPAYPHSSRHLYFTLVLSSLLIPISIESHQISHQIFQSEFSFELLFHKIFSSIKMPVATATGGEARLKAFKNRGKDTEVNLC